MVNARKVKDTLNRKVINSAVSAEDVEVHLSHLSFEGVNMVEIREYVPSTKTYGRGIVMPEATALDLGI